MSSSATAVGADLIGSDLDRELDEAVAGMTDDHKQALKEGRARSKAVKAYLAAKKKNKKKRGRARTKVSVTARIETITDIELPEADPLQEVLLEQELVDLERELLTFGTTDISELEEAFKAVVVEYSRFKGIEFDTWVKVGVEASVLNAAGATRAVLTKLKAEHKK